MKVRREETNLIFNLHAFALPFGNVVVVEVVVVVVVVFIPSKGDNSWVMCKELSYTIILL